MSVADAPRYWRSYRGCRCYNQRTGLLKRGAARRLGLSLDHCEAPHTGSLCDCPAAVYVGQRRAKIMARSEREWLAKFGGAL